jgi:copper chaperone CopZ
LSFQLSIALRSLTVHHPSGLPTELILTALEACGFDVVKTTTDTANVSDCQFAGDGISGLNSRLAEKIRKHTQQCSLCMNVDGENNFVTHKPNPRTGVPSQIEAKSFTSVRAPSDGPFYVTLSVGGMTCTSCTHSITNALSELSGVSDVVVVLLNKSATAVIEHRNLADDIVTTVEDCGFEAQIVNLESVKSEMDYQSAEFSRTISLRVDGMFCPYVSNNWQCGSVLTLIMDPGVASRRLWLHSTIWGRK